MSTIYLAGIDIGTTGAKTAIFDLSGKMVSSGYREYACAYPKANWVEQDPELLVASSMEASREAIAKSGIDPKAIAGIGVSAQRSCTIFVDGRGVPVRPMISWQDNRTSAEVDDIKQKFTPGDFYRITGSPLATTWIVTKILWLRKNEPRSWEKVARVVQLHDYALRALGADDFYEDIPDAAFFGLWDTDALAWREEARRFVGALRPVARAPVAYAELPSTQHAFETFYSVRSAHTAIAAVRFGDWVRTAVSGTAQEATTRARG